MPDYPARITPRPKRPSFPTVISLLALFVALGGTSYAVVKLPASSVGNRELKRDAVTASKIRNGTIGPADLNAAVSAMRGPRGPQGPAGATGPSGVAGGPEPWTALPFEAGWTNYGSTHITGAFRKDQLGKVHLRGLVSKGSGAPSGPDVIATLPPGYRPPMRMLFSVGSGAPNEFGRVDVMPTGELLWMLGPVGEVDFTSLDGISFWTDS